MAKQRKRDFKAFNAGRIECSRRDGSVNNLKCDVYSKYISGRKTSSIKNVSFIQDLKKGAKKPYTSQSNSFVSVNGLNKKDKTTGHMAETDMAIINKKCIAFKEEKDRDNLGINFGKRVFCAPSKRELRNIFNYMKKEKDFNGAVGEKK